MNPFEKLYKQLRNDPEYRKEFNSVSKKMQKYPSYCTKTHRKTHDGATCKPCKRNCEFKGNKNANVT